MVSEALHVEIMAAPGRAGQVLEGTSDRGGGIQWEHDAKNGSSEINTDRQIYINTHR